MPLDMDLFEPLTPEEASAIVDSIARRIVERRLETPAVLFFEMHKPLSFLASQAAIVAMPFLGPLIGARRMADLSRLLSQRDYVEQLISRIEEMAAERDKLSGTRSQDKPAKSEYAGKVADERSTNSEDSK